MKNIVPIIIAIALSFVFCSFTDRNDRMVFIEQEYEEGLTKKELAEKCLKKSADLGYEKAREIIEEKK